MDGSPVEGRVLSLTLCMLGYTSACRNLYGRMDINGRDIDEHVNDWGEDNINLKMENFLFLREAVISALPRRTFNGQIQSDGIWVSLMACN